MASNTPPPPEAEAELVLRKRPRRRRKAVRVPEVIFAVISPRDNPHANADVEVFTQRRRAERACTWGGQQLVEYVRKDGGAKAQAALAPEFAALRERIGRARPGYVLTVDSGVLMRLIAIAGASKR